MSITLSDSQDKAIKIIKDRYLKNEMITTVAGFAGSGKSTIIRYFIENMNLMDNTIFCTYTGKASLVLQQRGLPAQTIHSLIYDAYYDKRTEKFHFKKKPAYELSGVKLIVIDEISMVPKNLLLDLAAYKIPIVALGDDGQLPPIGEYNGLLDHPHIVLTEIHRQAENNPIIYLSMLAREGKKIPFIYDDPFVKVISRKDLDINMLMWADQILCAKNDTRRSLNNSIRKKKGYSDPLPEIGDKMICLRNYWDIINDDGYPLINGTIGEATYVSKGKDYDILGQDFTIDLKVPYSKSEFSGLVIDANPFKGYAPEKYHKGRRKILSFDYGYAITVHKSQGSEFDKVLLYDELLYGVDHKKLLYTGITRAGEKLVLVLP